MMKTTRKLPKIVSGRKLRSNTLYIRDVAEREMLLRADHVQRCGGGRRLFRKPLEGS